MVITSNLTPACSCCANKLAPSIPHENQLFHNWLTEAMTDPFLLQAIMIYGSLTYSEKCLLLVDSGSDMEISLFCLGRIHLVNRLSLEHQLSSLTATNHSLGIGEVAYFFR